MSHNLFWPSWWGGEYVHFHDSPVYTLLILMGVDVYMVLKEAIPGMEGREGLFDSVGGFRIKSLSYL